jgi:hypothetical protein
MTDPRRPYREALSKLSGSELSRVLAEQLQAGRQQPLEVTPIGDVNRSWLMPDGAVETVFQIGSDGRPEAVTRLVASPSPGAVRNGNESELAWLKRRVDEITTWRHR